MALAGGADVVFELPTGFATQSAEIFAHGGVALAQEMGADFLSFGTEAPVALLNRVTDALAEESDEFQHILKQNLEKKRSFAQSRTEALNTVLSLTPEEQALIYSPNAILAIEYLLKLKTFKSTIKPITISRKGSHYSDSSDKVEFPSATAVRKVLALSVTSTIRARPWSPKWVSSMVLSSDPVHIPLRPRLRGPEELPDGLAQQPGGGEGGPGRRGGGCRHRHGQARHGLR